MENMTIKSGDKTGRGTYRQLDYLADLCNESSFGFSHKKWASFFSKEELSKAIEAKKANRELVIKIEL